MKFAVDIWFAPEDADAYREGGMFGCADEEHHFDTLEEAWKFYTTPRNVFHMQLIHYPNYKLDEWGDGNVLAEGKTDDYIMLGAVERLRLVEMSVQDFLGEKIDSLEFCRNMRDMEVIE